MMQALTLNEFQSLAKNAKRIAVFQEVPAGKLTPDIVYGILKKAYKTEGVMLEDLQETKHSRHSFICFEPIATLKINNGDHNHPLTVLRALQAQLAYSTRAELADLITSSVGFITYDAIRYFEEIPDQHAVDPSLPIVLFNFYALSLAFDHNKKTILVSTLVDVGDQPEQAYQQAQQKILSIKKMLSTVVCEDEPSIDRKASSLVEVDTSDSDFMRMIKKAKDYIIRGDAFQIVLSRCFKRQYSVSPFKIYKTLRRVSPSAYMFYFPTDSSVILGASPEQLVGVHNKKVTVNPIAGTRRRTGERPDEVIAADLLSDKKELAEHMMLVDLARNDLGAVSEPDSVKVSELLNVKHYSHVSHITSTVTGKLKEEYDALDAFVSAFPAGTLSGAPKIRAMQIIDELETSRRGLYGGAICRLDSLGNLDSCIAIRAAILKNGIATIRTGAGIVFDSNPESEARETSQKAQSMLDAIAQAHGE
jgi:anthranilate synthase component 1